MARVYFDSFNHIDLRRELDALLNGSQDVTQIGQWVILRRFDLNSKSANYNEITREGVEGPKYNYTDELHKTYKWNSWTSDPFTEQQVIPGQLTIPLVTFFFKHDVRPKEQDEVFEFDWDDHRVTPVLSKIQKPYDTRYNIKNVQTYRLDYGRIEFFACRSIKEIVKY